MLKKFELNRKGVAELMKSPAMTTILSNKAKEISNKCGDGYITSTFIGKNRANASVYTESKKAARDNAKNNTLLKALK